MKKSPTILCLAAAALCLSGVAAQASIAYGTTSNFDCVNDTGSQCHGFEIEIEDIHSTDITYTYNYNHYGTPKLREDNTVPLHPKTFVRYESARNTNGSWAAFTAVPAAPIAPTQGHSFTNPSVNFGGEHFGVGYRAAPTAVRYFWLLDNGAGVLVRGPEVMVSTPAFTYYPPAGGAPAQVQAVIRPAPAPPVLEFGPPSWVKEIRTTAHNNQEVRLRDLVSDDPDFPPLKDWRNGEPDEVEVEWQLLQTDFVAVAGGANGELLAAPEDLPGGDEVVTRRYEFYKYTGPIDAETGEALADVVAADGLHGEGSATDGNGRVYNLADYIIVGAYLGAQMSAFDVKAKLGLAEHLADGRVNSLYTPRTVVIAGNAPFTATTTGALPAGLTFNAISGIVSGTPTAAGTFTFTVKATDTANAAVTKTYLFTIAPSAAPLPPHYVVDTSAAPIPNGSTTGSGSFGLGAAITVSATPNAGYSFMKWTDNGATASLARTYSFGTDVNRSLVAIFTPIYSLSKTTGAASAELAWTADSAGWILQESTDLTAWVRSTRAVAIVGAEKRVVIPAAPGHVFFRLAYP